MTFQVTFLKIENLPWFIFPCIFTQECSGLSPRNFFPFLSLVYIYFLGNLTHACGFKFSICAEDTKLFVSHLYPSSEFQTDMTNWLFNIPVWMLNRHSKATMSQNKFQIPYPIPLQNIFLLKKIFYPISTNGHFTQLFQLLRPESLTSNHGHSSL